MSKTMLASDGMVTMQSWMFLSIISNDCANKILRENMQH